MIIIIMILVVIIVTGRGQRLGPFLGPAAVAPLRGGAQ